MKKQEITGTDFSGDRPFDIVMSALMEEIVERQEYLSRFQAYMENTPITEAEIENSNSEFLSSNVVRQMSRNPYARSVVNATVDRLTIAGFLTKNSINGEGDGEALSIFKTDQMDSRAKQAMGWACGYRSAYLFADPWTKRQRAVPPTNAAVMVDAYGEPVAAVVLTRHRSVNRDIAHLFYRDVDSKYLTATGPVQYAVAARKVMERINSYSDIKLTGYDNEIPLSDEILYGWEWIDAGELQDIDIVPVTSIMNIDNRTEFEFHEETINRINNTIWQRNVLIISQAFKSRAIIGKLPERDPETGEKIDYSELFRLGPFEMWGLPEGCKIWESPPAGFQDVLASIKEDIRDLASHTNTPMVYFSDAQNQSAEGAKAQKEGYLAKLDDRKTRFGYSWRRHMAIMLKIHGKSQEIDIDGITVVWAPTMIDTINDQASAFSQLRGGNLNIKSSLRIALGATPEEMRRIEQEERGSLIQSSIERVLSNKTPTPLERNAQAKLVEQERVNNG